MTWPQKAANVTSFNHRALENICTAEYLRLVYMFHIFMLKYMQKNFNNYWNP